MTTSDKMIALVRSFPTLRSAPCIDVDGEFSARVLLKWAAKRASGSGERGAVAFVLNVWSPSVDWNEMAVEDFGAPKQRGNHTFNFNMGSAMWIWDREHLAAFKAWAADPFLA